jgi:membrane protein YdbS with pleckstrin-like domain
MGEPVTTEDEWQRLDPRYPAMARLGAWVRVGLWAGLAVAAGLIIWWLADLEFRGVLILLGSLGLPVVVLAILSFRLPVLRYRNSSWRLDRDGLEIRRGAWWFTEVRVPRSRIQHTEVSQGPLERRYELARLVVYTAGTHHGQITLRGIAREVALGIRDQLLQHEDDAPI